MESQSGNHLRVKRPQTNEAMRQFSRERKRLRKQIAQLRAIHRTPLQTRGRAPELRVRSVTEPLSAAINLVHRLLERSSVYIDHGPYSPPPPGRFPIC